MKSKKFYAVLLITTSNLIIGHASYCSDRGRKFLSETDQKIMEEAEARHEGAGERRKKREQSQELQKKGEKFKKNLDRLTKPLSRLGTTVGIVASASGDPHAKAAAAAFKLSIAAIDVLGEGVADIVIGIGRYKERSQEILSNAELLLEVIYKSITKKEDLEKKLQELLQVAKLPEPSQSSSRLKNLVKGTTNALKTAEIKAREAADVLTNEKAKREERIKAIQADLKAENEYYAENINLLQILVMQDTLREIDKKINIEDTIAKLETSIEFYEREKQNFSKSKSERIKQIANEKVKAQLQKDLIYYMKYQKNPTESLQKLEEGRSELIDKIAEVTQLTKMGDSIYLQQREVKLDAGVNKSSIVALYREIDDLKSQLEALRKTISNKEIKSPPLKNTAGQHAPLAKQASPQNTGSFSEKEIKKQRESLRPTPK